MNYVDMIYSLSPEYLIAYEKGFNDGRDMAVKEMLATVNRIAKTEGVSTCTSTVATKE